LFATSKLVLICFGDIVAISGVSSGDNWNVFKDVLNMDHFKYEQVTFSTMLSFLLRILLLS